MFNFHLIFYYEINQNYLELMTAEMKTTVVGLLTLRHTYCLPYVTLTVRPPPQLLLTVRHTVNRTP